MSAKAIAMGPSDSANDTGEPRLGRSISLDHAAELLGVSRRTVYNRIREGRLQTIRTRGGSQRVLLKSVTTLLSPANSGFTLQGSERHP